MVRRIYVEKKAPYAVKARQLQSDIKSYLGITGVTNVRELVRYDCEGISDDTFNTACKTVFSEPPVDDIYFNTFDMDKDDLSFSIEALPGQFDQRADSAEQCIGLINADEKAVIKCALTYVISGNISDADFEAIKSHCINPVDSRFTDDASIPETLITNYDEPDDVIIFNGFINKSENDLKDLYNSLGLAMTFNDFLHIQNYFKNEENRDPSMTEIRVLDTYWSDHCRHTTFSTELKSVEFEDGYYTSPIKATFDKYMTIRSELYGDRLIEKGGDKFICLMDLALLGMKKLKSDGKLADMEESEEINACSVVVPITIKNDDGSETTEEWLLSFKNETHNHPTEIEPFGGAATCLGGAIRDPLSGRSYVYQAMRITGAADPTVPASETLKGKLSQKRLVRGAASGYSSYGNQIGLATGYVKEIYHPNYVAKRMEIGAVMGAAPRKNVIRETSDPGDIIILLGGRTGRDGCGGATGSSKVHTESSLSTCGAEVQKGNPPTERKIQRLFRRPEVSSLIKKCNDFGAGGVSVAIGELADGLIVDLDKVPKKYAGLDGTELAISESQERMAVVVDPKDVDKFLAFSAEENLEAVCVATVTKEPRLVLNWRGKSIVNLKRAFLDTNGAHQETTVYVDTPNKDDNYFNKSVEVKDVKTKWMDTLADLNVCSQRGLVEMFDASIGAASVTMPYGGAYQQTEVQTMVANFPLLSGHCDTVSMMSYGFNPYLSSWSPYHGAIYAVTESIAKIVAAGGDHNKIRFTFQEYFRRMSEDPKRWSQPFAALLGAFDAQLGFGLPSIGGKDSMSGTFNDIDVPPTLVSFAVDTADIHNVITPEFKAAGSGIAKFDIVTNEYDLVDYEKTAEVFTKITAAIKAGIIKSAYVLGSDCIASAISKMSFGNKIGAAIDSSVVSAEELFKFLPCTIIAEVDITKFDDIKTGTLIGKLNDSKAISYGDISINIDDALSTYEKPLEKVFPTKGTDATEKVESPLFKADNIYVCKNKVAKPTVFIPVMPGTNCEYDSARAFRRAGADVITTVFKNQNAQDIKDSVEAFKKAIASSQIVMFPGGFSAGDEPEGSAKFFATAFRNEVLKEEMMKLLNERDGLSIGICNGFQTLIKLGLVPTGEIVEQAADSATLTFNTIGRHISRMVYTKLVSNKSPWTANAELGKVYVNPASHGEGRFVAPADTIKKLFENGQVLTQYCDLDGNTSMDELWNVNGSYNAIEGITSPDGRVIGKMAHSERRDDNVAINIYGEQDLQLFESGVKYFK